MQSILLDQPEQTATLETLAAENIRRDLYRQNNGDGPHAPPHQFRLRTLDYPDFETLSDGRIKFVRMCPPTSAFLFTWVPEEWDWIHLLDLRRRWLDDPETKEDWSSGSRKNIPRDAKFYLNKRGEGLKGIFASGRTSSGWFPNLSGGSPNYNTLKFDVFLDPREKVLDVEQLQDLSTTIWIALGSGAQLVEEIEVPLSERWTTVLEGIERPIPEIVDDSQLASVISADEGGRVPRTHLYAERDQEIVRIKKELVLRRTGRLACEVCEFDFVARYGEAARGICECHHTKLISKGRRKTRIDDLAIVCPNCHRVIHKIKPMPSVAEMKKLLVAEA